MDIRGDNGPLFYTQERIGKNGKNFKMYKYRSMVIGAEEKLKQYLKEKEEINGYFNYITSLKSGITELWYNSLNAKLCIAKEVC